MMLVSGDGTESRLLQAAVFAIDASLPLITHSRSSACRQRQAIIFQIRAIVRPSLPARRKGGACAVQVVKTLLPANRRWCGALSYALGRRRR